MVGHLSKAQMLKRVVSGVFIYKIFKMNIMPGFAVDRDKP